MSPVPVDRLISALPATEIGWFDCPCEDQWESLRYMMGAGVGLHDQKLSLSDLVSDEPRQALWRYSEHFKEYIRAGTGMLMYGSNGNGKTMAAVLLAKDLLSQGVKAYFTTYAQLIQTAFASYQSEEAKEWYYQKVRGAHLLVIDDVGKELRMGMQRDISNVAVHLIDDVLRHRYSAGLPTVVTTNELLVGLAAGYGSGVLSLMSENMITFNFTGGDWRTKARARFDAEVDQGLTRPIVFR
jgi:DNA replication protein DnaC